MKFENKHELDGLCCKHWGSETRKIRSRRANYVKEAYFLLCWHICMLLLLWDSTRKNVSHKRERLGAGIGLLLQHFAWVSFS